MNFYIFKFHPVPIVMNKHTGRAKIGTMSADLKLKYGVLESALSTVFFFFHLSLLMVLLWSWQLLVKFNVNAYEDVEWFILHSAVGKESSGTTGEVLP